MYPISELPILDPVTLALAILGAAVLGVLIGAVINLVKR